MARKPRKAEDMKTFCSTRVQKTKSLFRFLPQTEKKTQTKMSINSIYNPNNEYREKENNLIALTFYSCDFNLITHTVTLCDFNMAATIGLSKQYLLRTG